MSIYSFGWKRQGHDPRDHYRITPNTVSLPAAFKLPQFEAAEGSPLCVPRQDQSSLGSCGPNTANECILSNQGQEGLSITSGSRLFVYWNTRYLMGTVNQDSGVDNRSMMKALATYGWCDESLWPYVVSKFTQKPPDSAYAAAKPNTKLTYSAVVQSLQQMKGALYGTNGTDGDPFVFGFEVFQQIESDQAALTGVLTTPGQMETPIGGHDVSIYGWDDSQQVFFFRNHWRRSDGQWWGNNGNGTIPYAYALSAKLASDFWIINAIPGAPQPVLVSVPNVVGMTLVLAMQTIKAAGLVASVSGDPSTTVASQSPSTGTSVPFGSSVSLTMAVPAPPVPPTPPQGSGWPVSMTWVDGAGNSVIYKQQ